MAFENRSFAAFRSAASKATGVGGGGGAAAAGGGTGAPVCASAGALKPAIDEKHRIRPTKPRAIVIDVASPDPSPIFVS